MIKTLSIKSSLVVALSMLALLVAALPANAVVPVSSIPTSGPTSGVPGITNLRSTTHQYDGNVYKTDRASFVWDYNANVNGYWIFYTDGYKTWSSNQIGFGTYNGSIPACDAANYQNKQYNYANFDLSDHKFQDGQIHVAAVAGGLCGATSSMRFVNDRGEPKLNALVPANNSYTSDKRQKVYALYDETDPQDNNPEDPQERSWVNAAKLYVDGLLKTEHSPSYGMPNGGHTISYTPVTDLADGLHETKLWLRDNAHGVNPGKTFNAQWFVNCQGGELIAGFLGGPSTQDTGGNSGDPVDYAIGLAQETVFGALQTIQPLRNYVAAQFCNAMGQIWSPVQ